MVTSRPKATSDKERLHLRWLLQWQQSPEQRKRWQEQKEQQAKERKRKSELKKTEDEIALLENRNGEIDFQMTLEEVYSNSVKCQELSTERTKNELRLEELYEKWGELAE